MPRPSKSQERQKAFLPVIAKTFAESGYRRTTTAELAKRCEVQEIILFRLWPSKKAMFLAAIDYVYALSEGIWSDLLRTEGKGAGSAKRLLDYESAHHGEFGMYRILFAGLSETDDPDIHDALRRTYGRFQEFVREQIEADADGGKRRSVPDARLLAWAFVGLGTVANITSDLGLTTPRERQQLIKKIGLLLLKSRAP